MEGSKRAGRIGTLRNMFMACAEKCLGEGCPQSAKIIAAQEAASLINEFMELIEEDVKDRG